MCTALTLLASKKHLFGRNMDMEYHFGQQVVITPRNYKWEWRHDKASTQKYATIGMAFPLPFKDSKGKDIIVPLYAEAANEAGLGCAGLNFPGNAYYPKHGSKEIAKGAVEICPWEVVPYFLAHFKTTAECKEFIIKKNVRFIEEPIAPQLATAPLHFIITDKKGESIVIEPTKDGLKLYDSPIGIMTNNPTYDFHLNSLAYYQNLGFEQQKEVKWVGGQNASPCGQGFASVGLPGDWTPASRFIRTCWLKNVCNLDGRDYDQGVAQFFHILDNVAFQRGAIRLGKDKKGEWINDVTIYNSCINLEDGIYYYKTEGNNQIQMIDMYNEKLDGTEVVVYPFNDKQGYNFVNPKKK